ncbi:hypothetical protein [Erythrobacter mangrovi]|uniref:Uncharacterized protein n=1 Tax=Erythrobacter mangrovi TaxID=2739433 RepID=A0A7D4CDV6_9SPHN|nr:hypothetical protein [Erythrobacter mangrovi]QKG71989.1 hypothetical protein HQR01_11775 [Erythrobacter mangrovi]
MSREELFASRVYRWAAIYGIPVLALSYFQPVPDPWHLPYLSFVGTALVFQGVFLVIARDPRRFKPLMPVTLFEKLCFGVPAIAFSLRGQAEAITAVFGAIDLMLMVLFFIAWRKMVRSAA